MIPEDWDAKPLKSLSPFITSGSRGWAKYYADVGDAFVRITNLSRQNICPDMADLRRVKLPASENEGTRTGLRNGDVLVSITADIGIIGYVDDRVPKPAYINQHIAIVRVDPSDANAKFLSYFLATEGSQRRVRATTDAGAKAGMSLSGVGNLLVACPPNVSEQAAIAEALSDMDEAIAAVEAVIAKKRALKTATMQALLSGTRRMPGFSGQWEAARLGKILRFKVGYPFQSRYFSPETGGLPLARNRDLRSEAHSLYYYGPYNRDHLIDDGDVLIGMDGDFSPVIWKKGKALLNQRVGKLHLTAEADLSYLAYRLISPLAELERVISGTTVKHLSHYDVEDIEINLPKLAEQRAISSVLRDVDADIRSNEQEVSKLKALKVGLMQQLLTGTSRLI